MKYFTRYIIFMLLVFLFLGLVPYSFAQSTSDFVAFSDHAILSACACTSLVGEISILSLKEPIISYEVSDTGDFEYRSIPVADSYYLSQQGRIASWSTLVPSFLILESGQFQTVHNYITLPCGSAGTYQLQTHILSGSGHQKVLSQQVQSIHCDNLLYAFEPVIEVCSGQLSSTDITITNPLSFEDTYMLDLRPPFLRGDNFFTEEISYSIPPGHNHTLPVYINATDLKPGNYQLGLTFQSSRNGVTKRDSLSVKVLDCFHPPEDDLSVNDSLSDFINLSFDPARLSLSLPLEEHPITFNVTNVALMDTTFSFWVSGPDWISLTTDPDQYMGYDRIADIPLSYNQTFEMYLILSPPANVSGSYHATVHADIYNQTLADSLDIQINYPTQFSSLFMLLIWGLVALLILLLLLILILLVLWLKKRKSSYASSGSSSQHITRARVVKDDSVIAETSSVKETVKIDRKRSFSPFFKVLAILLLIILLGFIIIYLFGIALSTFSTPSLENETAPYNQTSSANHTQDQGLIELNETLTNETFLYNDSDYLLSNDSIGLDESSLNMSTSVVDDTHSVWSSLVYYVQNLFSSHDEVDDNLINDSDSSFDFSDADCFFYVYHDELLEVNLSHYFIDPDGDKLEFSYGVTPYYLKTNISGETLSLFLEDNDFIGVDIIEIIADDGRDGTASSGILEICVMQHQPSKEEPSLASDDQTTTQSHFILDILSGIYVFRYYILSGFILLLFLLILLNLYERRKNTAFSEEDSDKKTKPKIKKSSKKKK